MSSRTSTTIAMEIAYGHKVSEEGDIYVTLANKALTGLGVAGIFGTYLVDYIPIRACTTLHSAPS